MCHRDLATKDNEEGEDDADREIPREGLVVDENGMGRAAGDGEEDKAESSRASSTESSDCTSSSSAESLIGVDEADTDTLAEADQ